MHRVLRAVLVLAMSAAAGGCYEFRLAGPEEPPDVPPVRTVEVTVSYRQPNGCLNVAERCDDLVVFFGSWMPNGDAVFLERVPETHFWTGRLRGVPVNYPPRDAPYLVRVFDPHIVHSDTGGVTGSHLEVGQELLEVLSEAGTPRESALVYIDRDGFGHNP